LVRLLGHVVPVSRAKTHCYLNNDATARAAIIRPPRRGKRLKDESQASGLAGKEHRVRSHRFSLSVLAAALLSMVAVIAPAAAAGTPFPASGSFSGTFVQSNFRTIAGYTVFDFVADSTVTGTLVGTSHATGTCVIQGALAKCGARETFIGTVAGRSGTLTLGEAFTIDFSTGSSSGSASILSGTGGLRTLRGELTFSGPNYSGQLVFLA
jgi:Protein of unknown function (DUF3224)